MPEPSRLVLLEQLHDLPAGTKVRFLGCVHEYHDSKACVLLRNHYPASTTDVPTAVVSIEGMLDNFRPGLLQVGAWLNVIGNVRSNTLSSRQAPPSPGNQVSVDATTIWSAGAIKLEQYTATVREYQKPLRTG